MKVVRLSALCTGRHRKYSWYSFLLEAESTPGPQCAWKDHVNEKFQWHHLESNLRPSDLQCSATTNCTTAFPLRTLTWQLNILCFPTDSRTIQYIIFLVVSEVPLNAEIIWCSKRNSNVGVSSSGRMSGIKVWWMGDIRFFIGGKLEELFYVQKIMCGTFFSACCIASNLEN